MRIRAVDDGVEVDGVELPLASAMTDCETGETGLSAQAARARAAKIEAGARWRIRIGRGAVGWWRLAGCDAVWHPLVQVRHQSPQLSQVIAHQ